MIDETNDLYKSRTIVRIATAAERTPRAAAIMQYLVDHGSPVTMQDLYTHFPEVSNRTVRKNVAEIDDGVVKKYRTADNTVEVTLPHPDTTALVLATRRVEGVAN